MRSVLENRAGNPWHHVKISQAWQASDHIVQHSVTVALDQLVAPVVDPRIHFVPSPCKARLALVGLTSLVL